MDKLLNLLDSIEVGTKNAAGFVSIEGERFVYSNGFVCVEFRSKKNKEFDGLKGRYKVVREFFYSENNYELEKVKDSVYVFENKDFNYIVDFIVDRRVNIEVNSVFKNMSNNKKEYNLKDLLVNNDELFVKKIIDECVGGSIILLFNRIVYDGAVVRAISSNRYMFVEKGNKKVSEVVPVYLYWIMKIVENVYGYDDVKVILGDNVIVISVRENLNIMCVVDYVVSESVVKGTIDDVVEKLKNKRFITVFKDSWLHSKNGEELKMMLEKIKRYVSDVRFEKTDDSLVMFGLNNVDGISVKKKIGLAKEVRDIVVGLHFKVEDLLMIFDEELEMQVSDDKEIVRYRKDGIEMGVVGRSIE